MNIEIASIILGVFIGIYFAVRKLKIEIDKRFDDL